jgi:tRNA A-37 threonylcarbamoyl transferase component Bud32
MLHRVRAGLCQDGYLLAEKIENALDLREFLDQQSAISGQRSADSRKVLRETIQQVGKVIRKLHARHLSHRDLKAANLLITGGQSPRTTHQIAVWFIDLVGVVRHQKLGHTRRAKNLARLHASFCTHPGLTQTDKLRFLRAYLHWGLHGKEGWKKWWHAIDLATRAKVARNQRSGRPLM